MRAPTPRTTCAIELRDHALAIISAAAAVSEFVHGMLIQRWEGAEFCIMSRRPSPGAAGDGGGWGSPYGLNIWRDGKQFNEIG